MTWETVFTPLAGIGLFLFAMSLIEDALHAVSGRRLREFLIRNTQHPARGILSGTAATAILQSSSVVGLLMLAFVGAGVIEMRNALAVIFGSNLGTTATGWFVATLGFKLDLGTLAIPLIAVGGLAHVFTVRGRRLAAAKLILGLGLLLMGLEFMKGAVDDVTTLVDPEQLAGLSRFEYLLFGVLFSAVVQSSSATMMVTLTALNGGLIDLPSAAAIAVGADLGTTSTVLVGAIGGSPAKKRVAMGHFFFNVATAVFGFVALDILLVGVGWIEDPLLVLVAFHSVFNLVGVLAFGPFLGRFGVFLERLFQHGEPRLGHYLDDADPSAPEVALIAIHKELAHLTNRCVASIRKTFGLPVTATDGADYATTKRLEGEIIDYALGIDVEALERSQRAALDQWLSSARNAVQSAKLVRDVRNDVETFEHIAHPVLERFRAEAAALIDGIEAAPAEPEEFVAWHEKFRIQARERHDALHDGIFTLLRDNAIRPADVASALNINRALANSVAALLDSITEGRGASTDEKQKRRKKKRRRKKR